MTTPSKDTIYIDVDDEITSIIDKIRGSSHKVVALVLPKRAATLQSIVNMKLLKRTAEEEKKNLVLITSESGLLPLAGSVGLHVAKTLQSKPEIPAAPDALDKGEAIDEPVEVDSEPSDFDPKHAGDKPIGDLAGMPPSKQPDSKNLDDEIDLGSIGGTALAGSEDAAPATGKKGKKAKAKKDKKLKIPDFILFRRWLLLGGAVLVLLIILFIVLGKVLPKATVTVQTTNSTVKSNLNLALDTATKSFNPSTAVLPATAQQTTKTNSQQAPATGQRNNGQKASGQVTLSLNDCSQNQVTVPAGSGITSGGLTFITQGDANMSSIQIGGKCKNSQFPNVSSATVSVSAQTGGANYNLSNPTFNVPNYPSVTGSSSGTSGGTDQVVKLVAQTDIDNASKQLSAQDTAQIKTQLQTALQQAGLYAVPATFNAGTPTVASSPAVGTPADAVIVTQTVIYTMLGIQKGDLQTMVKASVGQQIDTNKQNILNDGVDQATFTVSNQSASKAQVNAQVSSDVGVKFDTASIQKQVVGKKAGDIKGVLKSYPGVTDVNVHFSPFWVNSAPSNSSKITINIKKAK